MRRQVFGDSRSGLYEWLHDPVCNRAREDERLLRSLRASYLARQGGMARLGSCSTAVRPVRRAANIASRISRESTTSERYTAIESFGFELFLERAAHEASSERPRKTHGRHRFGLTVLRRAKPWPLYRPWYPGTRTTHIGASLRSQPLRCDVGAGCVPGSRRNGIESCQNGILRTV